VEDNSISRAIRSARRNPMVRRGGIPLYRLYSKAISHAFPPPRVLVNGIPKSGTHLVTTVLRRLPKMIHSGYHDELDNHSLPVPWNFTAERHDWSSILAGVSLLRDGQYMTGHFPYSPVFEEMLSSLGFAHIVVLRDPRDVVVSTARYRLAHRYHPLHYRYAHCFRTLDECIRATITGYPADSNGRGQPSIGYQLRRYLPWVTAWNSSASVGDGTRRSGCGSRTCRCSCRS
jgi:sulfotransferase 6B1